MAEKFTFLGDGWIKNNYFIVGTLVLILTHIFCSNELYLNLFHLELMLKTRFRNWHKIKFQNIHSKVDFCLLLSVTMSRK